MTLSHDNFSLLRKPDGASLDLKPLPIAIAHALASVKLGDQARVAMLNRLFQALTPADQLRCRHELEQCKAARRGLRLASITTPKEIAI